jgi:hypothetical protein
MFDQLTNEPEVRLACPKKKPRLCQLASIQAIAPLRGQPILFPTNLSKVSLRRAEAEAVGDGAEAAKRLGTGKRLETVKRLGAEAEAVVAGDEVCFVARFAVIFALPYPRTPPLRS